jgi:hypothetical protein
VSREQATLRPASWSSAPASIQNGDSAGAQNILPFLIAGAILADVIVASNQNEMKKPEAAPAPSPKKIEASIPRREISHAELEKEYLAYQRTKAKRLKEASAQVQ